ncbi:MAG: carboxypeptidase-like regulatory domain-containing protein, partial [Acidobacteriota bacterium]|nr:carboxypeptidase-like regulatory domain-containing protein [Acidobacteriota bacterium]
MLALLFVLVLSPLAQAQYRTSIQGVVTDPSGAVVPNATLTLINPATNEKIEHSSNAAGVYNFNALPAGSVFRLVVTAQGFEKKVIDNVTLIPDAQNALPVQLVIGAAAQTVNVNASDIPALETATANSTGVIAENQIQHMPSFGRDVFQLAQLAPGAFGDGSQGS